VAAPPVPKLGVGLAFQEELRGFLEARSDSFDYLEVVPDVLWDDRGAGAAPRYVDKPEGIAFLDRVRTSKPVVPHSIGLSIGSAHRFDGAHVEHIARWHEWLGFPWHSDHLAFHLAETEGGEINVGLTMPLPREPETLDLLIPRVAAVRRRIPVPFLLENNVAYFDLAGSRWGEAEFLNRVCAATGCGLLLDLHNLHVNCLNLGGDPEAFLDELDLDNVVEIHVAGGLEYKGFTLDAHSGATPAEVLAMLDRVLPSCRRLGGVTFELFGSWYAPFGEERLGAELDRLRELWFRHQPAPGSAAA
jgi:uncharacterized protein (UPF0276 family)